MCVAGNEKRLGIDIVLCPFLCLRENSNYFSLCLHHAGILFAKMRNLGYKHGKISYLDYVNPDFLNRFLLNNVIKMLGYFEKMKYIYKVEKKRLSEASF